MDFPTDLAVYPIMASFMAGILFIHLGVRSKASLAALLSLTLLVAWLNWAHPVFHFLAGTEDPLGALQMSDGSSHPGFDAISGTVHFVLFAVFLLAFFLAAISVSAGSGARPLPVGIARVTDRLTTTRLWVVATVSMALSLLGGIVHRHVSMTGDHSGFALPSAIVALSGLGFGVLIAGLAIRRRWAR